MLMMFYSVSNLIAGLRPNSEILAMCAIGDFIIIMGWSLWFFNNFPVGG